MKKTTVAISLTAILFICACKNNSNDTTTNMPDSGYEPRTDATNPNPVTTDALPPGAVRADSIYNGHTGVSGVPDTAASKHDSTGKR